MPRLYRVVIQVSNIDEAADFYEALLGTKGTRVPPARHYFNYQGFILSCFDPIAEGTETPAVPNPDHIFIAVPNLEQVHARAKKLACADLEPDITTRPWGERSFYGKDPFGNPFCIVDERTIFTG